MGAQDSGTRSDSGTWADSSAPLTDREACDRAAAANDGSVPEVVSNNGRDVSCAAYYADAAASDAAASDARSSDGDASDGEGGAQIETHDGGDRADGDTDAAASDDGASDAANG